MTATLIAGEETWSGGWDAEGYRSYKVKYKVRTDDAGDGPCTVLATPGLPVPGAKYQVDNDKDLWAWCKFTRSVSPVNQTGDNKLWIVECEFSNKPDKRCQDIKVEDPLAEPYKLSITLVQREEEATHDRFGQRILSSSHESFQGKPVEFDQYYIVVNISFNIPLPQIELLYSMNNTVNAFPLWGLPRRTIKMTVKKLERKYWGICSVYYERELEFQVRKETFDRVLLDEGTKVLSGHWEDGDDCTTGVWVLDNICGEEPDFNNPKHFIRYQDMNGNMTRVILDGFGKPWSPDPPLIAFLDHNCGAPSCPGSIPETWVVRGFLLIAPILDNLVLTYVSGCKWEGTIGGITIRLDYDSLSATWSLLVIPLYVGNVWQIAGTAFNCTGSNLLSQLPNPITGLLSGVAPLELLIEPGGATDPGGIYVEKYDESDFLVLGIPAILQ